MQIYEALKKDHEELRSLLNELVSLSENDESRGSELIKQIRDELIPHARAEESVFYNSMRSLDAAKEIVMDGYKEHMEAETLLRSLQAMDKINADWTSTAKKLREDLEHHIKEEEGKIFNVAKQLFTDEEATMMCEAFEKLKPEVREEGFMQNTLDLIANVMPPRFASSIRAASTSNPQV